MIIQNNCKSIVNKIEGIFPINNNNKSKTNLPEKKKEEEKESNFKTMLDVEMKKLVLK